MATTALHVNMRRSVMSFSLAVLVVLIWPATALAATLTPLGTAGNYAVLAGSTVTNTGPSWITGQIGLSPGSSVTGFPPATSGHQDVANPAAVQAKVDLTTAYNNAAGQTPCTTVAVNLGGVTLGPGIYCQGTLGITAGQTLTLNGGGIYVFQAASTLITGSGSRVNLINSAQPCDIFWQVGSSATIATSTAFVGNIIALNSIAMQTGATLNGRALARNGAVTLDTNRIIQPSGCGYPVPAFVPPPVGNPLPLQDQSISFAPFADKILGEPPFGVTATASSGLPVTFTASGPCSVSGSTVSLSGTGVCTITAAQGGNLSFNAAPNVSQSFNVLSSAQFAQGVIATTSGMGLPSGTSSSLTSKLQAYVASTASGNQTAACGQLGAFVNYINAQSGKHIPAADAALLLTDAARLTTTSGC
ncbi:MAG TPA: ice-binding family protein [Candidatus Dormibacteraeota bacterium]|nr:ice-binding family protein [Candidatus Dormibacteraeota bacterium]